MSWRYKCQSWRHNRNKVLRLPGPAVHNYVLRYTHAYYLMGSCASKLVKKTEWSKIWASVGIIQLLNTIIFLLTIYNEWNGQDYDDTHIQASNLDKDFDVNSPLARKSR